MHRLGIIVFFTSTYSSFYLFYSSQSKKKSQKALHITTITENRKFLDMIDKQSFSFNWKKIGQITLQSFSLKNVLILLQLLFMGCDEVTIPDSLNFRNLDSNNSGNLRMVEDVFPDFNQASDSFENPFYRLEIEESSLASFTVENSLALQNINDIIFGFGLSSISIEYVDYFFFFEETVDYFSFISGTGFTTINISLGRDIYLDSIDFNFKESSLGFQSSSITITDRQSVSEPSLIIGLLTIGIVGIFVHSRS